MGANTLGPERAAEFAALETLRKIISVTTEIFGDDVQVKETCEPEFPDERYVVFSVATRGNPREVVAQEAEWIRRVGALGTDWDAFRLAIVY